MHTNGFVKSAQRPLFLATFAGVIGYAARYAALSVEASALNEIKILQLLRSMAIACLSTI